MSWQKMKLGELCKLNYGKGLSASNRIKGKYAVYSSAGHIDSHCKPLIESKGIIIGRKGSIGTIFYSDSPFYPIDTTYFITPENNYNLKFLYYNLKTLGLKNLNSDAAVPGLNRNQAYSQEINIPSIQIQKRIADILSAYDDLIENNLKRIKLLEQAAQNIYKEWFVNMRFPGHENTPIDQETGLPEGWKECRISDTCLKISSGGTPSRKNNEFWINPKYKWVTTKELKDNYIVEVKESISQMGLDNSSAKLFPKGTIVMAIYASPTLGRLGILTEESCFNQAAVGFICDSKRLNNEFLFYKLLEERDNLNAIAIGAAQQNINVGKVKEHKIVLPNIDLINEYRKEILSSFNLRLNLVFQNQKLKSARDILLPRLMNQTIEV